MSTHISIEDIIEILSIESVIEYIAEKHAEEMLEALDFDDIEEFYLNHKEG